MLQTPALKPLPDTETAKTEYQYDVQVQNDTLKREYAKAHSIPLIEISYKNKNIDSIKAALIENSILKM